ncbi:MAG: cytochrome c [Bacteroidetes bacterium]|nr:cytochrome c [Bacteroidota bacterium]
MKRKIITAKMWITMTGVFTVLLIVFGSCAENQKIAAKSGAQLWAENCQRCHNTPSPASFSHSQWVTIGMHMQTRAQLTDKERDKIVAFLQQ